MKTKIISASLFLLFISLFIAIYFVQVQVDQTSGKMSKADYFSALPQGELLKSFSLGYFSVIADLLWLEVVQAIGEKQISDSGYQGIYHAVDVVTSLDPKFDYSYQIAGIALASLGKQYDLSNKILLKGIQNTPEDWKLPFYLGFNYYFYLNDYQNAAKYISLSATLPGHPAYLPGFAARLYVQANDPDLALDFLKQIYLDSKDESTKEQIENRIKEVIIERDIRQLNKAIEVYQEKVGEIHALSDLVRSELIQKVPSEPFGGFYFFDPGLKGSQSSTHPNRMKVFKPH
jgi:tetratricopeptide (TPR) repeat protein